MRVYWNMVLLLVLIAAPGCHSGDPGHAAHSSATSQPAGVRDLHNQLVNPFAAPQKKATVLIFVKTDCPISNHYAPEIQRLQEKYAPRDVAFWLIYSDPDTSVQEINDHQKDYRLTVPALRDPRHALVHRAGAIVTPEVAVFLADGREVYCGRIDDKYADFGKERAAPTKRDLDEVLGSVAGGKTITPSRTRAVGCYIPEVGK